MLNKFLSIQVNEGKIISNKETYNFKLFTGRGNDLKGRKGKVQIKE